MSDTLDQSASDLLNAAKAAGQDIATFVQQQAPDVAKQLVRAKLIADTLDSLGFGILMLASAYLAVRCWRGAKREKNNDPVIYWAGVVVLTITTALLLSACESSVTGIIQCLVTPKAVIFHELKP
jgi:hypothetical protein